MDTGTRELEFLSFKILDENGAPITHCRSNDLVVFQATIIANQNVPAGAIVGLLIADKTGYHLAACNTNYYDKTIPALRKSSIVFVEWRLHFPFALGEFRIDIGIKSAPFSTAAYDRVFCVKMLSVAAEASLLKKNFGGYLFINPDIKISIDSSNTEYCDADHDTVS
ncbi:MAG: Wzt carbohydrate-binding domain-containing protein [Betaproteobacteria bacterium]|nr:Wzt carbohydrate-binding domain-containing protein [Betaproteobacteria bacterium]